MSLHITPPNISEPLKDLAALYGIQQSYLDVAKRKQHITPEALFRLLRVLGADLDAADQAEHETERKRIALAERGLPPVVVGWDQQPATTALTLTCDHADRLAVMRLELEDGTLREQEIELADLPLTRVNWSQDPERSDTTLPPGYVSKQLTLPGNLPHGYHRLHVEAAGREFSAHYIRSPERCYFPGDEDDSPNARYWGVFLPLYSLSTQRNWGAGTYRELEHLAEWSGNLGGGITGTLPLLSSFLQEPYDPSPYAPVSRLFWNEVYIDITAIPELQECPEAQQLIASPEFQQGIEAVRDGELIDYRRLMGLKRRVLEVLAAKVFSERGQRHEKLMRRAERQPLLDDYARFRAAQETFGKPWFEWPDQQRNGRLSDQDFDEERRRYHVYAQLVATEQLEHLSVAADATGTGLYLDLPLGIRADGYDVWRLQHLYANGAYIGAPPDTMFTKGQNWGFAPQHPEALREQGYHHVREYLHHHLQFSRQLRIDHVMGLHRLYWIPKGSPASDGAYVRYRPEEWYAVLNIESHRHRACVIGENLGTVPPEVDHSMDRHGIRKMFVVQYQLQSDQDDLMGEIPPNCVACVNTHDMPPFAAWWKSLDVDDRHDLGLIDAAEVEREKSAREELKRQMVGWLAKKLPDVKLPAGDEIASTGPEPVLHALLYYLAKSPAEFLLVNLEDLWGETQTQNVPGTVFERPNWQRRAKRTFEQFTSAPDVVEPLRTIHELRSKPL